MLLLIINGKIYKKYTKATNLRYQPQHGIINLNYPIDHILYQLFKIVLSISTKNETLNNNSPIKTYLNKIEHRTTFEIKSGYYIELLTPKTMKLLRSTERKIIKQNHGESVPNENREITKVTLVH